MVWNLNQTFSFVRALVFGAATISGVLVLAFASDFTNWNRLEYSGTSPYTFQVLGIVAGALNIISLPLILLLSLKRKGAVLSIVAIEFGWILVLSILWICTSGPTAYFSSWWVPACYHNFGHIDNLCTEVRALNVLCFFTWITLFIYNLILIFLVIRQHMRGNSGIWKGYINETDFTAARPSPGLPSSEAVEQLKSDGSEAPFTTAQYPYTQAGSDPVHIQGVQATSLTQGIVWSPYPEV